MFITYVQSTNTRYNGNTIQRPPRPTFQSYTQLHSNKKQLSQSLSSISNIFKRNLHAASSWRLDQIPRKYDQGNMVTSLAKSEGNLLGTSSSRPGNELGKGKEFEEVRPFIREHTSSGFRIDYSKYEKCIKESEKILEDPLSAGIGKWGFKVEFEINFIIRLGNEGCLHLQTRKAFFAKSSTDITWACVNNNPKVLWKSVRTWNRRYSNWNRDSTTASICYRIMRDYVKMYAESPFLHSFAISSFTFWKRWIVKFFYYRWANDTRETPVK